jgi:hypothetical protein
MVEWRTIVPTNSDHPSFPPPPFPFDALLEVGTARPSSRDQLLSAMGTAQIGQLADCHAVVPVAGGSSQYSLRVTWHGRGARTHTFDIGAIDHAADCSNRAAALFLALLDLSFDSGSTVVTLP